MKKASKNPAHELGAHMFCIEFSQIASVRKCCSAINPRFSEFTSAWAESRFAPLSPQGNAKGTVHPWFVETVGN
jgi:hypothetical protein